MASDWIQTYSGKQIFPLRPDPAAINLRDIAHALANLCRFTGHTLRFYSVAEHCVRVSRRVYEITQDATKSKKGCLHDGSEAYLVDVPSPLKRLPEFAFYRDAETRLQELVFQRFDLTPEMPPEVHQADRELLATERAQLLGAAPASWGDLPEPLYLGRLGWSPDEAEERFINRFRWCESVIRMRAARGTA